MRAQSDKTSAAADTQELWNLIMRIAEPTDLLKTIIDRATPRPDQNGPVQVTAFGEKSIVIHGCTITIHQHITAPADPAV